MDKLDLGPILIRMLAHKKTRYEFSFAVNDEDLEAVQNFYVHAGEDIHALIMEVNRLHAERAEVRRDALLDVCKMQCWMCEENKELAPGKEFNHKMNGWLAECHAHDVRRMIAAEQGKESKESK